jgi:microcystin-dependent protein
MTSPFTGEVQIFGFTFAPQGWAFCNGVTLTIPQNTTLYSLIGVMYGGNGTTTFQLPNLASRAAMGQGTGPSLTPRVVGETVGAYSVTLNPNEIPLHNHILTAYTGGSERVSTPVAGAGLGPTGRVGVYAASGTADAQLYPQAVVPYGGNQAHGNQQPLLALNFCIALVGDYPSFN